MANDPLYTDPVYRNNPILDTLAENYNRMARSDDFEHYIPPLLLKGLISYKDEHIPVGSFLHSVLTNNLLLAIITADPYSLYALPCIVRWCQNNLSRGSWGDNVKYNSWVDPQKTSKVLDFPTT